MSFFLPLGYFWKLKGEIKLKVQKNKTIGQEIPISFIYFTLSVKFKIHGTLHCLKQ